MTSITPPPHIDRALSESYGARMVADLLSTANLVYVSEDELQAAIQRFLDENDVYPEREVRLSDGVSRIDLLAGAVGIEVKIEGSWASVVRQLTRYAKCPEIHSLVLVTSRAKHHHIPEQLCGKPLHLVSTIGGGL